MTITPTDQLPELETLTFTEEHKAPEIKTPPLTWDQATNDDLRKVMVHLLQKLIERNRLKARKDKTAPPLTRFDTIRLPNVSLDNYLERLVKYINPTKECMVISLVYLDRFLVRKEGVLLTAYNVHRLVLLSLCTAIKFTEDEYNNNAHHAKVGGLPLAEFNNLELDFLFDINFSAVVKPKLFKRYQDEVFQKLVNLKSAEALAL